MELSRKLKLRRQQLGLTLREVAEAVGTSHSTVKAWEDGYIKSMKLNNLHKLSEVLHVPAAYLMGWEEDVTLYDNVVPTPDQKQVPILGEIACGLPILADENLDGYANIDDHDGVSFALRCRGDSMINARIFDGDLVFIREQPDVENGEIAAVLIGNEATLKRVYKWGESIELRAENPAYPPMLYREEQLNQIKILGKAVVFKSYVR